MGKIVQPVGTALPRSPRGPWQCRANSLNDCLLVGSVYKPHLGPHDLRLVAHGSVLFSSRPFPALRVSRVSSRVSEPGSLVWSRLARFFVGLPIFQLVTPIFPCFFGGVLRAVFRSFLRFFYFFRVFVRRFLFTALIFPSLRTVFC